MMVLSMASHTPPRRRRGFSRWAGNSVGFPRRREVLRIDPLLAAAGNSAALQLFGDVGSSGPGILVLVKRLGRMMMMMMMMMMMVMVMVMMMMMMKMRSRSFGSDKRVFCAPSLTARLLRLPRCSIRLQKGAREGVNPQTNP